MRVATREDREKIISILSLSFRENKSVRFTVKEDIKYTERLKLLMDYSFFMGMNFGKVFISEDGRACAIVLFPHKKKITRTSLLWNIKLISGCIGLGNIRNVIKRERLLQKHHPETPFAHLWYIGVSPGYQSGGRGSRLLLKITEHIHLPFYLETSTEQNLPFYEKFGFNVTEIIENLGYRLYIMSRK